MVKTISGVFLVMKSLQQRFLFQLKYSRNSFCSQPETNDGLNRLSCHFHFITKKSRGSHAFLKVIDRF